MLWVRRHKLIDLVIVSNLGINLPVIFAGKVICKVIPTILNHPRIHADKAPVVEIEQLNEVVGFRNIDSKGGIKSFMERKILFAIVRNIKFTFLEHSANFLCKNGLRPWISRLSRAGLDNANNFVNLLGCISTLLTIVVSKKDQSNR